MAGPTLSSILLLGQSVWFTGGTSFLEGKMHFILHMVSPILLEVGVEQFDVPPGGEDGDGPLRRPLLVLHLAKGGGS